MSQSMTNLCGRDLGDGTRCDNVNGPWHCGPCGNGPWVVTVGTSAAVKQLDAVLRTALETIRPCD